MRVLAAACFIAFLILSAWNQAAAFMAGPGISAAMQERHALLAFAALTATFYLLQVFVFCLVLAVAIRLIVNAQTHHLSFVFVVENVAAAHVALLPWAASTFYRIRELIAFKAPEAVWSAEMADVGKLRAIGYICAAVMLLILLARAPSPLSLFGAVRVSVSALAVMAAILFAFNFAAQLVMSGV